MLKSVREIVRELNVKLSSPRTFFFKDSSSHPSRLNYKNLTHIKYEKKIFSKIPFQDNCQEINLHIPLI
jgi:hypothetical protein